MRYENEDTLHCGSYLISHFSLLVSDMPWAIILALTLIVASILALAWAGRLRAASGLPDGEIISRDTGAEERGKPLFAERYGLTGTPDYVVRTSGGLVPVEVKPGRHESEPHDSHLLQVLA
jgi:CRISPR-associated exonuclease Cas4